jgi:hypothetical protein
MPSTPTYPTGLDHVFALIDMDGYWQDAGDVYPHAVKIINNMRRRSNGPVVENELMAASRVVFPGSPHDDSSNPDSNPTLASVGGFYVGVAVCWLLMTQINGGVR